MCKMIGAIVIAILVGFSGNAMALEFDSSYLNACMGVAEEPKNNENVVALNNHPTNQKLKIGFGDDFAPSVENILAQKDRLAEYWADIEQIEEKIPEYIEAASVFVGTSAVPDNLKINLVCGTPSDGYGFSVGGQKELFLDLSNISRDFFDHLMRHELWHIAFKAHYPQQQADYAITNSVERYLAYQILNEGVGHYYSFQRRLEPKIVYDNWAERTASIFAKLEQGYEKLLATSDLEEQKAIVWSSHAGVPFWQKWSAVTGAIMTYRLKTTRGADAVTMAVAEGPCGFMKSYLDEAENNPSWELPPQGLVAAACR